MQAVTTIGLDIAKSVFQIHGIEADGRCALLTRSGSLRRARWVSRSVHERAEKAISLARISC